MADASSVRVLLIEDETFIRETMCELLESCGFVVQTATHGGEALQRLREGNFYDVILLDWRMPHVGGETFRRHQLAHAAWAHIPTFVLSGDVGAIAQRAEIVGAQLMEKPVDLTTLAERVLSVLQRSK